MFNTFADKGFKACPRCPYAVELVPHVQKVGVFACEAELWSRVSFSLWKPFGFPEFDHNTTVLFFYVKQPSVATCLPRVAASAVEAVRHSRTARLSACVL